jgi:hypothetical protein
MEIIKQNETFNLKETTDAYEMAGSVSRDVHGSLNININVTRLNGDRVGDCYYNKYANAEHVNLSISSSEDNREELVAYANTVIAYVLEYFESNL